MKLFDKLFDKYVENSELTKKLVEAIETSTKLLKDISELCDSLTKRVAEHQLEINQIYMILESLYKQNDFDQQIEELKQTVKKDFSN